MPGCSWMKHGPGFRRPGGWSLRYRARMTTAEDEGEQVEIEKGWADEIERRIREMPPPGSPLPAAAEVFDQLRMHLAERRANR